MACHDLVIVGLNINLYLCMCILARAALPSAEVGTYKRENYFIGEGTVVGHEALMAMGHVWKVGYQGTPCLCARFNTARKAADPW